MHKISKQGPVCATSMSIRADFDVDVVKCDSDGVPIPGTSRRLVTKCPNLITDTGMDNLGTNDWMYNFAYALQVGSGSTAPAFSDATLASYVAGVMAGGTGNDTYAWDTSDNKVLVHTRVFQFGAGVATGTMTELGLSVRTATGALNTRALFKDPFGDPTGVPVASDEQLVVTYRVYFTPNISDNVLVITQGGTEYTITTRMLGLSVKAGIVGVHPARLGAFGSRRDLWQALQVSVYYGVTSGLSAVTATAPIGTGSTVTSPPKTFGAYVAGNHYRDDTLTIPLNTAVFNDIGVFTSEGIPFQVQIGISPRINKTNLDTIKFTVRTSWSRG